MAKFDLESIIKEGVDKAINAPVYEGKSITEWAAIGMKAPRWVSVKDRLPEDGWWMVSLVNNRTGHRWKIPVIAERYKGKWDFCKIFSDNPDATVTHYMPLPESPEEVSGDE